MVSHLNDAVVGPEMSARHSAVVAQQHEAFLDIVRRARTRFTIPCHAAQLALQATPRVSTEIGARAGQRETHPVLEFRDEVAEQRPIAEVLQHQLAAAGSPAF